MTEKLQALMAGQTTAQLLAALRVFEPAMADGTLSQDGRMARIWMLDEIESRYDVADAMEASVMSDSDLTYVEALTAALPPEALS